MSASSQQPNDATPATSRRRVRVRPEHQAAQLILRMSEEQRDQVHELAQSAGFTSAGAYLLDLAARDGIRRGAGDHVVLDGMFAKAESPGSR